MCDCKIVLCLSWAKGGLSIPSSYLKNQKDLRTLALETIRNERGFFSFFFFNHCMLITFCRNVYLSRTKDIDIPAAASISRTLTGGRDALYQFNPHQSQLPLPSNKNLAAIGDRFSRRPSAGPSSSPPPCPGAWCLTSRTPRHSCDPR